MKEEQKKLKKQLIIIFGANMLLAVSLILVLLFHKGISGRSLTETDFIWERFAIIMTTIMIPVALKAFHSRYQNILGLDMPLFLKKVKEYYIYRLLILDIVIITNLICFYLIGALNFLYMAVIVAVIFVFCYPTEATVDPIVEEEIKSDNEENL